MCGIYGFLSKKPKKYKGVIKALGYAMEERGTHSSGLLVDGMIYKALGSSHKLFESPSLVERLNLPASLMIGHTRWATIGAITIPNAHPITYPGIAGVHNGHVVNYDKLGYPEGEFEVDSMAAFKLLSDHSNDYKTALSKIYGQINLAWTDGEKLHLVKHGNPLYIALTEDAIFFCSTDVLETILTAAGFSFEMETATEDQVVIVDKKLNITVDTVKFGSAPVAYPAPASGWNYDNGYGYGNQYGATYAAKKLGSRSAADMIKEPKAPVTVPSTEQVALTALTRKMIEYFIYYANFMDCCDACGHGLSAMNHGMHVDVVSGTVYCAECNEPKNDMSYIKGKKVRKIEKKLRKHHDEILKMMREEGFIVPLAEDFDPDLSADDFVGDVDDCEPCSMPGVDEMSDVQEANVMADDMPEDFINPPKQLPKPVELFPEPVTLEAPKEDGFKAVLRRTFSRLDELEKSITDSMKGRRVNDTVPPAIL